MKTIKIFVASSEELKEERELMASLANDLSTKLEKIGIQVIAIEWENLDSSMGEPHKQEEYNEKLRECEMCMVLYWTKFGKYTKTELETAYKEKVNGKNPQKLWVYFKEVNDPTKEITNELKEFRDSFPIKYGHFYTPFANFDTLKAHFLLQFVEYQSQELQGKSIVEVKDGKVTVGGKVYVDLQNVPFAGNNKEYKDKLSQLKNVKKILMIIDSDDPDYKDYQEQLSVLQKDIRDMEYGLWDTALTITRLSNTRCSERLKRAADLFEKGDNKGARAVLNEDEIDHDIQHHINLIKLGEEGKAGLKTDIEELYLKLKLLKTADFQFQDEKYGNIESVFKKILECAYVLYDKVSEEVLRILRSSRFYMFEQPKRYIPYLEDALSISKKINGVLSDDTVSLYQTLIRANKKQGSKDRITELYEDVLPVIMEKYGKESDDYLAWLSDFGKHLTSENELPKAEQVFNHCLEICHKSQNTVGLAKTYNDLADLYLANHRTGKAKEYYDQYLATSSEGSGKEVQLRAKVKLAGNISYRSTLAETYYLEALETAIELDDKELQAIIYEGIATIKRRLGDIQSEISFLQKALDICPKEQGLKFGILKHLANSYTEIGDYQNALHCGEKSIEYAHFGNEWEIERNQIGYYGLLSSITRRFGDLEKAEYYAKLGLEYAIEREKLHDVYHFFQVLGNISCRVGSYNKALDYYSQALQFKGENTGLYTRTRIQSLIGWAYYALGNYKKAEDVYRESIGYYEDERNHLEWSTSYERDRNSRGLARTYVDICRFYIWTSQFDKAQNALSKSFELSTSRGIGLMDRNLLQAKIYVGKGMYEEAIKQLENNKPSEPLEYQWRNLMAEAYINWGKDSEALEWTNLLLQEYADDPYTYDIAGDYYAKFGDKEKAIEHYEFGLNMLIEKRLSQLAINRFQTKIKQIGN